MFTKMVENSTIMVKDFEKTDALHERVEIIKWIDS
jgi:hypothetical protein